MTTDEKDIDVQPIPTDAYKDADAALDSSVDKNSEEAPTLKEVIKEQAREEEAPLSRILTTSTVRKQIWIFLLITFFTIIYISNRYSVQQNLIEIDKLQKELKDARYKALSSSSQLTEKSRESNVLDMLKNNQDSVLKIANQPPYIIQIPNK